MTGRGRTVRRCLGATTGALVGSVLLVALTACSGDRTWSDIAEPHDEAVVETSPVPTVTQGGGLAGGVVSDREWERVIDDVRPLTYKVFNDGCRFDATGSAVAVSATTLLTNRHVVEGARALEVQAPGGSRLEVVSWRTSSIDDLAVMELDPSSKTPHIELGGSAVPGDLVAALGYPLGGDLTAGKGRIVATDEKHRGLIRASMDILPGNSGGPLVGTDGKLVGLVRAIDLVDGWAIAVPVERVEAILAGQDVVTEGPC